MLTRRSYYVQVIIEPTGPINQARLVTSLISGDGLRYLLCGCRIHSLVVYIRSAFVELGIEDPSEISKATSDRETLESWVHAICRGDPAGGLHRVAKQTAGNAQLFHLYRPIAAGDLMG